MSGDTSSAFARTTLSVDELEEKLCGLHDYLSSPYRARAEAVVLRRREREAKKAEDGSSHEHSRTPQPETASPVSSTPRASSPSVSPLGAHDGPAGLTAAAPPSSTEHPHTHAYVQQLEWQVAMLTEALAAERRRAAEMEARVVQPLLVLSEATLRRQNELECELAVYRETQHA